MATRIRQRRAARSQYGPPESFLETFDLRAGPLDWKDRPPPFADDDERRAAWERHRAWLLDRRQDPGKWPEAWWQYDSGAPAALRIRPAPDDPAREAHHVARCRWLASQGLVQAWELQKLRGRVQGGPWSERYQTELTALGGT